MIQLCSHNIRLIVEVELARVNGDAAFRAANYPHAVASARAGLAAGQEKGAWPFWSRKGTTLTLMMAPLIPLITSFLSLKALFREIRRRCAPLERAASGAGAAPFNLRLFWSPRHLDRDPISPPSVGEKSSAEKGGFRKGRLHAARRDS